MQEAIRTIMRTTMPGVFVAAITTAGTFFAFLATDFRGMTQLGFLTGVGILLFLLCVMFLLPALIVFSERKESRRAPKLYLHSFGAGKLIDISVAKPLVTIGLWAVFIVACGIMATRVRFSDNIQDLRAKGNPGVVNQSRITEKFGQSFDFMMYVCEGKTIEEALEKTRAASQDLDALVRDHTIASYQSISTFLPPTVDQREDHRADCTPARANEFNFARIEKTFRAALVENGFRPEVYDDYLKLFAQALQPAQPITLADHRQRRPHQADHALREESRRRLDVGHQRLPDRRQVAARRSREAAGRARPPSRRRPHRRQSRQRARCGASSKRTPRARRSSASSPCSC